MIVDKKYCVYVHIFPNGKQYVGMTCNTKDRWRYYGYAYSEITDMNLDIRKYGWDNIQHIILKSDLTFEDAKQLEHDETLKRNTTNKEFGYNTRASYSSIGSTNPMYGKSGKESPVSIPVYQYDKDGLFIAEYDSALAASIKLKIYNHINECCRNERKSCGGYFWSYEKCDKYVPQKNNYSSKNTSPVIQFDDNMNIVNRFDSMIDAKIQLGITNIGRACKKKMKAGGYYWRYANEYDSN